MAGLPARPSAVTGVTPIVPMKMAGGIKPQQQRSAGCNRRIRVSTRTLSRTSRPPLLLHTMARAPLHAPTHPPRAFASGWAAALLAAFVSLPLLALPPAVSAAAPPLSPLSLPGPPAGVIAGRPRVVDGDTLVLQQQRIRLYGLDAPETSQTCQDPKGGDYPCGQQSTEALASRIGGGSVECTARSSDQYGRLVATCQAGGSDLGHWMVSNGHAVAYTQYSDIYLNDEREAAAAHKGIWAGSFQRPNYYRKYSSPQAASPTAAVAAAPRDGCDVKGNISSSGQKIYHIPTGRYYEATKIDESQGERWFCSPKEAEAAGWRPSKQ